MEHPRDLSDSIDDFVSTLTAGDFLSRVYHHEHRVFPGAAEEIRGVFGWDDLNEILETHQLRSPQMRLSRDGRQLPEASYLEARAARRGRRRVRVDPVRLRAALGAGHTLAMRYVDEIHPGLSRLSEAFERRLLSDFEFNLYASWAPTGGFNAHWDNHDVFAIQLQGRKRWRIFGRNEFSMHPRDSAMGTPPAETVDDLVLSPGDVLFLPRGYWHDPVTEEGPSLHITGSIPCTTGLDLVHWLVEGLREDEAMCAELLRFGDPEGPREALRKVRERLNGAFEQEDLLKSFFAARDGAQFGRFRLGLPDVGPAPGASGGPPAGTGRSS
ncbi:cupin domain-containing protein [Streptomyces sp. NPDC003720]|uniref:cupin domain-containing protein n=1 Tax=Streptomyces sp. NPDC003720 TaxID=3364684 RepID=UPI0036C82DDD